MKRNIKKNRDRILSMCAKDAGKIIDELKADNKRLRDAFFEYYKKACPRSLRGICNANATDRPCTSDCSFFEQELTTESEAK